MKLRVLKSSKRVFDGMVSLAPCVLALVAGYFLFLVIVPFFMLGVHRIELWSVATREVQMSQALGTPAAFVAFILLVCSPVLAWVWLLGLVNFVRTRRTYVLILLALAPLPIAYLTAGPYHMHLAYWIWAL